MKQTFQAALVTLFITGFLLIPEYAFGKTQSFCGRMDFTKISNADIEIIVFNEDLSQGRKLKRQQCGLPGETLAICSACSNISSAEMMTPVWTMISGESHLKWHTDWHKKRAVRGETDFLKKHGLFGSSSGEDFFYMHRMMIKMVQVELATSNQPCISPWTEIPSIDDSHWPIAKKITPENQAKVELDWDNLQKQFQTVRDPSYLSKISLNKLGQVIELGLHQNLHNFYRGNPKCSAEVRAFNGTCDDLIPVETSPMNRYFWKLHGLVDELLGRWLHANNYDEISESCSNRSRCYQWKGTWAGDPKSGVEK